MLKKETYIIFFGTVIFVASLHVLKLYLNIPKSIINLLFGWSILGFLVINIFLFLVSMSGGFRELKKVGKNNTKENKDNKAKDILGPILQGYIVTNNKIHKWTRIAIIICFGLFVGSIIGFILNRFIT